MNNYYFFLLFGDSLCNPCSIWLEIYGSAVLHSFTPIHFKPIFLVHFFLNSTCFSHLMNVNKFYSFLWIWVYPCPSNFLYLAQKFSLLHHVDMYTILSCIFKINKLSYIRHSLGICSFSYPLDSLVLWI